MPATFFFDSFVGNNAATAASRGAGSQTAATFQEKKERGFGVQANEFASAFFVLAGPTMQFPTASKLHRAMQKTASEGQTASTDAVRCANCIAKLHRKLHRYCIATASQLHRLMQFAMQFESASKLHRTIRLKAAELLRSSTFGSAARCDATQPPPSSAAAADIVPMVLRERME